MWLHYAAELLWVGLKNSRPPLFISDMIVDLYIEPTVVTVIVKWGVQ